MPSTLPLSARLRHATQGIHRETERRVDLDLWLSSPEAFERYMQLLSGWWGAVEECFTPLLPPDLGTSRHVSALHADLSRMHLVPEWGEACPLADLELFAEPRQRGFGYVVLGSRLDGRAIAQRARKRFGGRFQLGALEDAQAPTDWRRIRAWIDELGASPPVVLDGMRAAHNAFDRMGSFFAARSQQPDAPVPENR